MVANSSQMVPSTAPLTSVSEVSGRVTARVTASPPSRQARVPSHSDQASRVRLGTRMGARLWDQRYGSVTARPGGPAG